MSATVSKRLFLATVQQYAVDFMVEEGFATGGIHVDELFQLEHAMRQIRLSFKYPTQVLQHDREIARYPATLWSHILATIGLCKYAKYKVVLLNEHLAFPSVEVPPESRIGRVFIACDYRVVSDGMQYL